MQVKNEELKKNYQILKNCLLNVKRKLALLLILKIPTIKKAVELLNSIGVLKLTAVNFKKTNIMKKMLFGLIATVMLSVSANAQTITSSTKKAVLNAQVVTIVEASKSVYIKGMSYDDFVRSLLTPSPTIPNQNEFYKTVYNYINKSTSTCDILNAEHPEFEKYINELAKDSTYQKAGDPGKKKWWQILINVAINVGLDVIVPGNNIPDVDLWP